MSQENVSTLRSLYAQFADGKVWAVQGLLAPDVESSWPDRKGGSSARGPMSSSGYFETSSITGAATGSRRSNLTC
jgi:hypothetical protein